MAFTEKNERQLLFDGITRAGVYEYEIDKRRDGSYSFVRTDVQTGAFVRFFDLDSMLRFAKREDL